MALLRNWDAANSLHNNFVYLKSDATFHSYYPPQSSETSRNITVIPSTQHWLLMESLKTREWKRGGFCMQYALAFTLVCWGGNRQSGGSLITWACRPIVCMDLCVCLFFIYLRGHFDAVVIVSHVHIKHTIHIYIFTYSVFTHFQLVTPFIKKKKRKKERNKKRSVLQWGTFKFINNH